MITVSLQDLQATKKIFNRATKELEKGADYSGYVTVYSEIAEKRSSIIEAEAVKNVRIMAMLLKVEYNTVIDMIWDVDFAKKILEEKN